MRRNITARSRERVTVSYCLTLPATIYATARRAARTLDISTRAYLQSLLVRAITKQETRYRVEEQHV